MSFTITVPQGYSYVGGALISTVGLLLGHFVLVTKHRKLSGIKYPQVYADKQEVAASNAAHLFNCAQRCHQNTLEMMPIVHVSTLVASLKYPIPAAAMCASWVVGRIFFTRGYMSGDPAKRAHPMYRIFGGLSLTGLIATATYVAALFIWEGI